VELLWLTEPTRAILRLHMAFSYALLSVLLVSAVSFVGVWTLSMREESLRQHMHLLIALAAGALLGDAFIHLIPEALTEIGNEIVFGVTALLGMLGFFVLEKTLRWHHHHNTHGEGHPEHPQKKPLGTLVLVSDSMHNFVDGIIIGASYLVSAPVGIATTIAVLLHEIPQEISDFSLLLHAGFTRAKAVLLNFASALTAVLGTIVFFVIGGESLVPYAVALTAGGFIYIAATDLVPELHQKHEVRHSVLQFVALLVGVGLMLALTLVEG
jgi:zinc and cadmium transporter